MSNGNGARRAESYQVEQIDDVRTRLARLEGRSESMATREDVANAKLTMLLSWVGIGVAVLIGIINIGILLLRTSSSG